MVASVSASGVRPSDAASAQVWDIAATVLDPEVPALTIEDLGVLREASFRDGIASVVLTPTYSGCPAMDRMSDDVREKLAAAGYEHAQVTLTLAPAWTTDWMSEAGKRKLEEFGIAPPAGCAADRRKPGAISLGLSVKCPRCHSLNTSELAHFGSTACKSLYQCQNCQEPFDYFKVH